MPRVKHVVLDVLKPHHPNVLEFAQALAAQGPDFRVRIDVRAVDEKTETIVIEIDAGEIDYASVADIITSLGGSVHSIDQVEVHGGA